MEVFPIDFIAREGPLSFFQKDSSYPKIIWRTDLTPEAFENFYRFCQLALDASPTDVEACAEYLPQASPKEQALILTILYVYVYPWENFKEFTDRHDEETAVKTRSWLALVYPFGAFDVERRNRFLSTERPREGYRDLIESFLSNENIAFPALPPSPDPSLNKEYAAKRWAKATGGDPADFIQWNTLWGRLSGRKKIAEEIREEFSPTSAARLISGSLYCNYWSTIWWTSHNPSNTSSPANASAKPKTVGQIAQELLESWEAPASERP